MLLHYGSFLKQAQRTGWLEGLPGKRCLRYFQNCEMMVSNYILQALKSFHHHHHHHHHHPSPIIHHPSSIIHHPSSIIHHHHHPSSIIIIHHHPSIHPFLKQAQRTGWLEGLPGKRCLRYFQNCEMMVSNYILQALKWFHHHHPSSQSNALGRTDICSSEEEAFQSWIELCTTPDK